MQSGSLKLKAFFQQPPQMSWEHDQRKTDEFFFDRNGGGRGENRCSYRRKEFCAFNKKGFSILIARRKIQPKVKIMDESCLKVTTDFVYHDLKGQFSKE